MSSNIDFSKVGVGFIGGGNMATAIGTALLKKNIVSPERMWVSSPTEKTLNKWKKLGVQTTFKNGEVVKNCYITILAVKPQMLDVTIQQTKETLTKIESCKIIISILVGISVQTLREKLGTDSFDVVRAMPNTASMIGEGITVYCYEQQRNSNVDIKMMSNYVTPLFSCMGIVEMVSENLMNAIGALSGSGPAYVYTMIEALADGAVRMGVPRTIATQFAAQIMVGAGKMVLETGKHPGQLKDEVCSPHGTTIAGIHAMERGGVRGHLMNAIEAAVQRSEEISEGNKRH